MSMFAKHASGIAARAQVATESLEATPVTQETVSDKDPLAVVDDAFAEQRSLRNQEHGLESITPPMPVDGMDDDQTVPGTKSDVELPEGEHGEDADVKTPADGVEVDADDSDVSMTSEMDEEDEEMSDPELDDVEDSEDELVMLENQMRMMVDSAIAIEQFGINPTAMAVMQTTGLLDGTALSSLGLESVNFASGKDAESQLALEALGDKMKETSAKWSAKIMHVVKSSGEMLMKVLNPLWDKISMVTSKLVSGVWDKTKAASSYVKAHPYKTIAAIIAAVSAVAAIVAYVASGAPASGAKMDVMMSFVNRTREQIGKIKLPGGDIIAKVSENGMKLSLEMKTHAGAAINTAKAVVDKVSVEALGWSQIAVKAIGGQLNRAWDVTKHSWTALGTRSTKLVGNLAENGFAKTLGTSAMVATAGVLAYAKVKASLVGLATYYGTLINVILNLVKLTRWVVVGGFRMILNTFKALMPHAEPATA